jgi:GntR family transcriptional regulator
VNDPVQSKKALLIVVDPGSGVPVYRQIMDQVKFQVAGGKLVAGTELPSTRALSLELGINPMTISKAYSFLEKEGVVERRPGKPLIVKPGSEASRSINSLELLRQSMQNPVTVAKQLNIETRQALELLREMLESTANQKES